MVIVKNISSPALIEQISKETLLKIGGAPSVSVLLTRRMDVAGFMVGPVNVSVSHTSKDTICLCYSDG